ncbi:MAG: hypothetical protein JEZ14_06685 [Marinilabiliaceae bacterium]|nr:hypothetical protein [Marinilabiliaceae bacterium]
MMKQKNNPYAHVQSFKDFENEKMKLYFQLKLSEKKLEIKYIELGTYFNPIKLVPALISEWLTPIINYFKNIVTNFMHTKDTSTNSEPESEVH